MLWLHHLISLSERLLSKNKIDEANLSFALANTTLINSYDYHHRYLKLKFLTYCSWNEKYSKPVVDFCCKFFLDCLRVHYVDLC